MQHTNTGIYSDTSTQVRINIEYHQKRSQYISVLPSTCNLSTCTCKQACFTFNLVYVLPEGMKVEVGRTDLEVAIV